MFDKSILSLGFAAAVVATLVAQPARAAPVGAVVAAGFVGAVYGAGLASAATREEPRRVLPGDWDYGSPGWQRPRRVDAWTPVAWAGPGRHRVCAWQDRYDRHERYVGSRRICWTEAR